MAMNLQHSDTMRHNITLKIHGILTAIVMIFLSPAVMSTNWDVASLMEALAQNKGGKATFSEKKYIAILDAPIESTGELIYKAPDYLEKKTLTPKTESFVLNGDTVDIHRGKKNYALQLQDYPEIAAFTASIRGTLAGDRSALEQSYQLSLTGTPQQWVLTLSPKDPRLTNIIRSIVVNGKQGNVLSIEINQADFDRSVMTIKTQTTP